MSSQRKAAESQAKKTQRAVGAATAAEFKAMRKAYAAAGVRADSWSNLYTGVGVKGTDKLASTVFEQRAPIGYNEVFGLYRENAIAKRQVDDLIADCTRAGFTFACDDDPDLVEAVYESWKACKAVEAVGEGMTWGMVCGGAVGLMLTDDEALDFSNGNVMATPLDPAQMGSIMQFLICDSRYAIPNLSHFTTDPTSPNFGKPDKYQVTPFGYSATTPSFTCHWSRILRFEGVPVDNLTRIANLTWGDSVYQSSWDSLMRYGMTYQGASLAAAEFGLKIMKMNGLSQLLDTEQYSAILNRVYGVKMGLSAARIAVIDSQGEDLILASQPVTGLPDLMDKVVDEVCMAIHESKSKLFGTSEGALATADANHKNRAEYVHGWQMLRFVPALTRITELVLASKNGVKNKNGEKMTVKPSTRWQIVPNPIDPPDVGKDAENRERQAKIDIAYIENRVLEPSEVRASRFGGTKYSHDTTVNPSLSTMIEANDKAALEAGEETATTGE